MDPKYLPLGTTNTAYPQAVSHELWAITAPVCKTDPAYTQYYTPYVVHPDTQEVALEFDGQPHYISPNADPEPLVALMTAVNEAGKQQTRDRINTSKGDKVDPCLLLPDGLQALLLTPEQMITAGWFSSEELPLVPGLLPLV